jgi:hypothetical protein
MFDFLTYLTSLFFNLKLTGVQLLGVTFRLPSQLTGVDGDDDVLDYVGDRGVAECQTSFNHVKVCLQFVVLLHVPHEFLKLENFSLVRRLAERRSKLCLTQVGAHQGATVHNLPAGLVIGADLDTARAFRPGPGLQSLLLLSS